MTRPREWLNPLVDWSHDPEESANTLTHGLGFLLSVIGAVALGMQVARTGDAWRMLGCSIYAPSLMAVYAMSTLSHVCVLPDRKRLFRMLDQGTIYLLIVGTYTPFSLTFLRSGPWWFFLAFLWAVAMFGCLSKVLLAHRIDRVAIWLYVFLGWLQGIAVVSLAGRLPSTATWWMVIGGLFYTVGTVFLILDRYVRHFHALWHLFVIAGSACHFLVIYLWVAAAR